MNLDPFFIKMATPAFFLVLEAKNPMGKNLDARKFGIVLTLIGE